MKAGLEDYEPIDFKKLEARAILLPDAGSNNFEDMEMEEYEFDIVWSHKKGLWVATLTAGNYLVNVKCPGYKEINEVISVSPSKLSDFKYVMKSVNSSIPKLEVHAINVGTGNPIKGVFFELWKENMQQPEEGLSDDKGAYQYKVKQIGIHYLKASKVGFVPLVKKVNFTKGFLASQEGETYAITVPMLKVLPEDTKYAYAVLSIDGPATNIKLKSLMPNGKQDDAEKIVSISFLFN